MKKILLHLFLFSLKRTILIFTAILFYCTALAQQPIINSFTPTSGPAGSSVTISGNNFSTVAANNIVFFGAVRATVTAASTNSLTVTVPGGATYQPIAVTTNSLTAYSAMPFISTFSNGAPITSNCFDTKIDSTTDLHPNMVTIADFDGDGKPDIATPNNYSITGQPASVSILRNTGTGNAIAFAPHMDIATGVATYAIASGDLNGDGKPDLVSSSVADKTISVFKNTSTAGNISFATKIDYATGSDPFSIAISDFDGDGKPDIAVTSYLSNTISIYRNTTTGGVLSFAAKLDFTTALGPRSVAAGDFDNDGKVDIAVSNEFSNSVSLFKNNSTAGNISFAAKVDYTAGTAPYSVAAGDLNNDGKLDLAVCNNTSFTFSIFKNTSTVGTIGFAAKVDYAVGANPYLLAITDVNGDGKPDVVVPSANLSVSENNSTAGSISFLGRTYIGLSPNAFGIALADLNNDGRPEIAGGAFTQNFVSILRNKNPEPAINNFTPITAAMGGTITINGDNFTNATAVKFGGVPAASFTVVNSSTITAVVSAGGASGAVTVTNSYGTGSMNGFTFAGPPVITSFTPTTTGYGQTVTITGLNLSGASAVSFGDVPAFSFTVVSPTTINAIVNTGATGRVKVTTPYGTDSLAGFTFVPLPVIATFSPTPGATGTVVAITGGNFTGATAVSFGGVPAASFTVNSNTSISAVVGNGASGSVSVTTTYGTASMPGFIFIPAPTITSFTPTWGVVGTVVTINGTNFQNITGLYVGTASYTNSYTYISPTQIQLTLNGQGSTGSISVTTPGGTASMPGFVFNPQPTVTSISPTEAGAGMPVTITGTNFTGSTAVTFGGTPVSSFVINSPTSITAIVGTGASGQVVVTNPYGVNSNSPNFTFATKTIITSVTPTAGPVGSLVTITGGNFNTTAANNAVYFGAVKATIVNASSTVLTVTVPAGSTYDKITVTNNYSTAYTNKPFNVTFPGGGIPFTSTTFAGRADFATGSNPGMIKIGDIDNDGKSDIIIAKADTLAVYRNISANNTVAFVPAYSFKASSDVVAIAVGDMDGDGKLDIVAATTYQSTSVILKNNSTPGNITLTTAVTFITGHYPTQIAIGDLNMDGKPDMVMSNGETAIVSYFRNNSSGGVMSLESIYSSEIWLPESLSDAPMYSRSILLNDLNNDGMPDIVVGSESTHYYVLKNTSFSNVFSLNFLRKDVAFSSSANDFIAADFDRDGNADLISNNYYYKGAGNYNFTNYFSYQIGGTGDIGDLDGDTLPDFACVKYPYPNQVSVSRNISTLGTISFDPAVIYTTGNKPSSVAIGDLDNDGKPDIAFSNNQSQSFSVLKNQAGTLQVCSGTNSTITSTTTGTTYQWQVDNGTGYTNITPGANYAGTTTVTLQLINIPLNWNGYQYRCIINGNTVGNVTTLIVNNSAVSVSITAPVTTICSGVSVTFTATAVNAGTTPAYQWKVNGVNAGTNSNTFTTTTLNNNDQVTVVVTSNSTCSNGVTATSNIITIAVNSFVAPVVNIATGNTTVCQGTTATFTATPLYEGTTPSYQWQVNGVNAGTNNAAFVTSSLNNNDQVKVILTSSLSCALPATATSNVIAMTVVAKPVANAGNDVAICTGTSTQLNASGGTTYSWSPATGLNNAAIANPLATPAATTAYIVTVSNSNNCTAKDTVVVSVNPITSSPTVSISTAATNICAGSSVTFTAAATNAGNGPSYQWSVNAINTGNNSNTFTSTALNNNDQVKLVVTSNATCPLTNTAASNIITMNVQPQLAVPVITLNNRVFTVTNPDLTATYTWQLNTNNTWANVFPLATGISFTVVDAGEYRVMVVKGACTNYSAAQVASFRAPANNAFGVYLFPNPANNFVKVDSIKLSQNWETLEVINTDGKLVLPAINIKNQTAVTINVSPLNKGTYFFQLRRKDGEFTTIKFVKL